MELFQARDKTTEQLQIILNIMKSFVPYAPINLRPSVNELFDKRDAAGKMPKSFDRQRYSTQYSFANISALRICSVVISKTRMLFIKARWNIVQLQTVCGSMNLSRTITVQSMPHYLSPFAYIIYSYNEIKSYNRLLIFQNIRSFIRFFSMAKI